MQAHEGPSCSRLRVRSGAEPGMAPALPSMPLKPLSSASRGFGSAGRDSSTISLDPEPGWSVAQCCFSFPPPPPQPLLCSLAVVVWLLSPAAQRRKLSSCWPCFCAATRSLPLDAPKNDETINVISVRASPRSSVLSQPSHALSEDLLAPLPLWVL